MVDVLGLLESVETTGQGTSARQSLVSQAPLFDLEQVDALLLQLEACVEGRQVTLPSNAQIVQAVVFVGSLFSGRDALYDSLLARLNAPVPRIDRALVADFQALRQQLDAEMLGDPQLKRRIQYVPNHIPAKERLINVFFAACLVGYAILATRIDDFYIPGKRGHGIHLHGVSMWIMVAAAVCAVIALLTVVIDHYDQRDNERVYEHIGKIARRAGWCLFVAAFIVDLLRWFS